MTTKINLPQQFRLSKRNRESIEVYCKVRRYWLDRKGEPKRLPSTDKVSDIIFLTLCEAILHTVDKHTSDELVAIARGVDCNKRYKTLAESPIVVADWPQQIRLSKHNRELMELYCELRSGLFGTLMLDDTAAGVSFPTIMGLVVGGARRLIQARLRECGTEFHERDDEDVVIRKLANMDRRGKPAKRDADARVAEERAKTDKATGAGEDRPSPPETPAVNSDAALNTAGRIDGLKKQLEGLRPIAEEYDRQRQLNGLPPGSHTVITLLRNEIRQSSDHIRTSIKLLEQERALAATDEATAGETS